MANDGDNTYDVSTLVTPGQTSEVDDDGGTDWLTMTGVYQETTTLTLAWSNSSGIASAAAGTYYPDGSNNAGRFIIQGVVENVRGSNGKDDIIGNHVANILYGDQDRTGAGNDDTISADIGNDTVYGGGGEDTIYGDDGQDLLYGDAGDDTVSGGGGADVIQGGEGADNLSGGLNAGDTVSYSESSAAVTIVITYGTTTVGKGGDAEGDVLAGFFNVTGSEFNDTIRATVQDQERFGNGNNVFDGGAGNDTLMLGGSKDIGIGGAGNDKLTGGQGNDELTGGADADTFIYRKVGDSTVAAGGQDTIFDFSHKDGDIIDLHAIDANEKKKGNQDFDFLGAHGFNHDAGDLMIKKSGDGYLVQGDTDGNGKADFAIFVDDVKPLKEADFDL